MAQCPKCGSNKASFKREVVGSKGSGAGVRVRVSKNVSVGTSGGNSKKQYRTIGFCPDCGYSWSAKERNPLVTVLLWLFIYIPFFPITLSVWFWKTPKINLDKKKKAIILAVIWVLIFVIGLLNPSSNDGDNSNSRGSAEKVSSASAEDTEKITEKILEDKEKDTKAESASNSNEKEAEDSSSDAQVKYVKNDRINEFLNELSESVEISDVTSSRGYLARFNIDDLYCEVDDVETEFRVWYDLSDDIDRDLKIATIIARVLEPDVSDADIDRILNVENAEPDQREWKTGVFAFSYSPKIEGDDKRLISTGKIIVKIANPANGIDFYVQNVRNDATGNWRISTIAEDVEMQDIALDYYNMYFEGDEEIHGIVNFFNNTTTCISVMGNTLDVTVHEYVDKEEHDADLLFSGMLLSEYFVDMETGEIEKIQ